MCCSFVQSYRSLQRFSQEDLKAAIVMQTFSEDPVPQTSVVITVTLNVHNLSE